MLGERRDSRRQYCSEVSSSLSQRPGIESQPWLTGCVTLGTSYMFIHLFTLTRDTLNLEILDTPNSFCSFWRHPSSLSTSQILSPVLTSFNLIPLLSDATLGARGLWGLWKTAVVVQLLCRVRLFTTPWTVCSPPGSSVLHYLLEFTQTVEPFYLQDAERENRKESHLDVPWEVSPSWFLLLYGPWRLCVEWLDCDSQATADAQKPIKGRWQDPLESDLLVGSDTEDVQVLSCCTSYPGLLQGVGWHGKGSAPAKIL